MVHFNCVSGKDRTGIADAEIKLLAYQMHRRLAAARRQGQPLSRRMRRWPTSAPWLKRMPRPRCGCCSRAAISTFSASIPAWPAIRFVVRLMGGLNRILAARKAQAVLQEYLGTQSGAVVDINVMRRLINGLSMFTGA